MSASAPVLLAAACAEWLITLRPLKAIARLFEMDPPELNQALSGIHPHTFRGKLESALQSPIDRPDLIAQKTHLARMEHQLSVLSRQFERAEVRIAGLTNVEGGFTYSQLFQAEQYANRLHQQLVKLLKEIHKAQQALEKAVSEPYQPTPTASPTQQASPSKQVPSGEQASPGQLASPPAKGVAPASVSPIPVASEQAQNGPGADAVAAISGEEDPPLVDLPISPPPTEEEFLLCIVKNRQRIRNAPASQRQSLMVRLIEQHRAANSRAANKHAA